jgi:hypothetical protein
MNTQAANDKGNRLEAVNRAALKSDSLVGSFFLADNERQWQGCVVAEPSPGIYLVELFSWLMGESSDQMLVRIGDMLDWQFYDTADWMRGQYKDSVKYRWEQYGKQKEAESTER